MARSLEDERGKSCMNPIPTPGPCFSVNQQRAIWQVASAAAMLLSPSLVARTPCPEVRTQVASKLPVLRAKHIVTPPRVPARKRRRHSRLQYFLLPCSSSKKRDFGSFSSACGSRSIHGVGPVLDMRTPQRERERGTRAARFSGQGCNGPITRLFVARCGARLHTGTNQ